MVEKFILSRASKSVSFSHQVLWHFFSTLSMGGEALSMKTVDFLQSLTDNGKNAIEKIQNTHLFPDVVIDVKSSSKFLNYKGLNFQHEDPLPEISLMNKLNTSHNLFFSTPKFISNLISVAEYLRSLSQEQRPEKLAEMIEKLNQDLPNNVYLPMKNFNGHRVLKISTEHAICLHSNQKAPFHILIEVENISFTNLQSSLIHEVEETKRQNHLRGDVILDTAGSHDSLEDGDENTSLKLSGETAGASYEESDESDDNHVHPFADHYAEDLLPKGRRATNQLDIKIHHKKFEESKILYRSNSEDNTSASSGDIEYQLSRVHKKKPSLLKKIFLCHCEDEEEIIPIINQELNEANKRKSEDARTNPLGLFGRKKFSEVKDELRQQSEHGRLQHWDVISLIVKSGENIQQEKFASLLIQKFKDIFEASKVK